MAGEPWRRSRGWLTSALCSAARFLSRLSNCVFTRQSRFRWCADARIIELDFVRATEAAALNSLRWLGRGDKEAADAAACDAMRGMFDLMNICGEVVIGEGIKDEAPGIFKGEQLGTWYPGSPEFHIA